MRYESFIARRYMKSGRFFITVSTWITVLGVTLGVAAVCVVMSVHNGFEQEIRNRLLGTTSHISIFPLRGGMMTDYRELLDKVTRIEGVTAASPFIYYKAAISSASEGDGIVIRGILPDMEELTSRLKDDMKVGSYSFSPISIGEDTVPGMIIGSTLAERLAVYLGDPIVLYSLKGEDLNRWSRPRVAKFYISGIFETGLYEFDAQLAYISLESAQELFKTGDAVTAVHLKLDDIYQSNSLRPVIDSVLGYQYDIVPWTVLHKNIFSFIAIEKKILFLGFILIVLVAAFSIISTLVMITMEKRAEIGILKTIGSTPASIRKIFVQKGLNIGIRGIISGWLLALVLIAVQNRFEIISLPPDIYFISYIPFVIDYWEFAGVGLVSVAICFLAALYPAQQAASVSVIEVLRK